MDPAGLALAGWLSDSLGPVVHDELRHLAAAGADTAPAGTDRAAAGAADLLATLPQPPDAPLEIRLLGPLQILRGGAAVDSPEVRRARVRELLSALVVTGSLTRDRAMALLWPDHDTEAARRNLRVTLVHLRRLLEPDRPVGAPGYFLRTDGGTLRLCRSAALTVDVWELDRLVTAAGESRRTGDTHRAGELLAAAAELGRGEPLADLCRLSELDTATGRVERMQADVLLTLGELRVAEGEADDALGCAERALRLDPHEERAHRLAIAAAMLRRDAGALDAVVARARRNWTELGVRPEDRTEVLLRQAAAWRSRHSRVVQPAHRDGLAGTG
jgi:LuxR family transcriptional regulator, maltose regulon positive regulatory protein